MSIEKIGYTDSYGGLISAVEAKHLTEKGKEEQRLKRWNDIQGNIKNSAYLGYWDCFFKTLSEQEKSTLISLGYSIENSTYVDSNQNIKPQFVVSWKLEDKVGSESSETKESSESTVSSSSDDN